MTKGIDGMAYSTEKRHIWKANAARALTCSALFALTLGAGVMAAGATDYRAPVGSASGASADGVGQLNARFLPLGIGKSTVIDLPRDIKDVLVGDPKIANAVVRSAQRAYIIGSAVGQTNIIFFDNNGQQIAAYDIAVTRDLNGIRAAFRQVMPSADIRVEGLGDGVVLSGSVASQAESQQATDLAARLTGGIDKVSNNISVRGRDQVMLKVTIAEVQRDIIKQLGVDLSTSLGYGTAVVNFTNTTPFSALGRNLISGNGATSTFGRTTALATQSPAETPLSVTPSISATLKAMETAGIVRTLAEPNLTAISGETANFLAGGEFPILGLPSCIGNVCRQSVEFKKFGISLGFTPIVLSEGRISLRVATEISELSQEGSVSFGGTTIPSLKVRRADTTLEIPSGGAMAMAGLIKEQTKQSITGLPGMGQLPVLGTLFRSRDYINNNTELMVLVTPYIVRAVAQKDLSRPDDGFVDSSDPQSDLLGSINRIYGVPRRTSEPARQQYRGVFGFITD